MSKSIRRRKQKNRKCIKKTYKKSHKTQQKGGGISDKNKKLLLERGLKYIASDPNGNCMFISIANYFNMSNNPQGSEYDVRMRTYSFIEHNFKKLMPIMSKYGLTEDDMKNDLKKLSKSGTYDYKLGDFLLTIIATMYSVQFNVYDLSNINVVKFSPKPLSCVDEEYITTNNIDCDNLETINLLHSTVNKHGYHYDLLMDVSHVPQTKLSARKTRNKNTQETAKTSSPPITSHKPATRKNIKKRALSPSLPISVKKSNNSTGYNSIVQSSPSLSPSPSSSELKKTAKETTNKKGYVTTEYPPITNEIILNWRSLKNTITYDDSLTPNDIKALKEQLKNIEKVYGKQMLENYA